MSVEIRIVGDRVQAGAGRRPSVEARLPDWMAALGDLLESRSPPILPVGVRAWRQRGSAVACAIEVPPQARTVRWLAADSLVPFGPEAHYEQRYLAFPYLVLLLVLVDGELTGVQQLYYRTAPLDEGEDLLLSNLLNVAEGHELRCWLCLQKLGSVARLAWPRKIAAVVDHVFSAAFNRSAELHEGNSYWQQSLDLDPRVASIEAWERASRENRWFALDVAWRPAGVTLGAELGEMLDRVVPPVSFVNADELVPYVWAAQRGSRRRREDA